MGAQKGNLLVLKVASSATGTTYTKVACMSQKEITFTREAVDTTCDDNAGYVSYMPGGGAKSVTFTGSGFFNNSATHALFWDIYTASTHWNFQVADEAGTTWTGPAHLANYKRTGQTNGVDTFDIELQFSGTPTVSAAAVTP